MIDGVYGFWQNWRGWVNSSRHMEKADEDRAARRKAPTFQQQTERARVEADALHEELRRLRRREDE